MSHKCKRELYFERAHARYRDAGVDVDRDVATAIDAGAERHTTRGTNRQDAQTDPRAASAWTVKWGRRDDMGNFTL